MDEGYDVVIGSRALPGARIEVRQPFYRENMGRLFNLFVRALAVPGLKDTQCGFKLFTAAAAEAVFSAARLDGFSFDVEALFLARKKGYRILYAHSQTRLLKFWEQHGFARMTGARDFAFSDFDYTEVMLETEKHPQSINLGADPYVIIRPEGLWDTPGVLEMSASRGASLCAEAG